MKAPILIFGRHWKDVCPNARDLNTLALSVTRKLLMHNPDRNSQQASNETLAHFICSHPEGAGFTIKMPFELWHRVQAALGEWSLTFGTAAVKNDEEASTNLKREMRYTVRPTKEGALVQLGGFTILVAPRDTIFVQTKEGRVQKAPVAPGPLPVGNLSWGKTSDDGFIRSTMHSKDSLLAIDGQRDFRFGTGADTELGAKLLKWAKSFRGYADNPFGDKLEAPDSRHYQNRRPFGDRRDKKGKNDDYRGKAGRGTDSRPRKRR